MTCTIAKINLLLLLLYVTHVSCHKKWLSRLTTETPDEYATKHSAAKHIALKHIIALKHSATKHSSTNYSEESVKQKNKVVEEKNDEFSSYKELYPANCGFSNSSHTRVVNGVESSSGAWPWMAGVGYRFGDKPSDVLFVCGGSLVTGRHVLTAAHCMLFQNVTFLVRLGALRLYEPNDRTLDLDVDLLTIHPQYNKTTNENDIAVLRLKDTAAFTPAIHPICLPLAPSIRDADLTRYSPFLAGWGSTYYGGPTSNVLIETQVPVVENKKCQEIYKNQTIVVDDRVLCAGYADGKSDACQGDSGGPLMIPDRNSFTYYLVGIVSSGFRCAVPGHPGIYTRVTHYLQFIMSNVV